VTLYERMGSSAAKVKSCHGLTSSLTKPEPAIRVRIIIENYFIRRGGYYDKD
jgi:hypothetical protein